MCPGQYYADAVLWATIVGFLSVFTISPPSGVEPVKPELINGAIVLDHVAGLHRYMLTGVYMQEILSLPVCNDTQIRRCHRPSPTKCGREYGDLIGSYAI